MGHPLTSDPVLLFLGLLVLLGLHGKAQELTNHCDIEVRVKRNTVWRTVPLKSLTITCVIKHCGIVPSVTWCKLVGTSCHLVIDTDQVKTSLSAQSLRDQSILSLQFKRISLNDDGLYRCAIVASGNASIIGHPINVSVSGSYLGHDSLNNNIDVAEQPGEKPSSLFWLPYVAICVGVVLLVFVVTVITLLTLQEWNGLFTKNQRNLKEVSTVTLPVILKGGSTPSSPGLNQTRDNNIYDNSLCGNKGTLSLSLMDNGFPPPTDTVAGGQGSSYVVYAALNHLPSSMSPRPPHNTAAAEEGSEYAAVRVGWPAGETNLHVFNDSMRT